MMAMGLWLLRGEDVFERSSLNIAMKCLAAAALMALVIWPIRDLYLPAVVVVGAVVYGGASLALGSFSLRDVKALRSYIVDRAGSSGPPPPGPPLEV
jgi:hypothetical protein